MWPGHAGKVANFAFVSDVISTDSLSPFCFRPQEIGYQNGGTFNNFLFFPGPQLAPVIGGIRRQAARVHILLEQWLVIPILILFFIGFLGFVCVACVHVAFLSLQ